MKIDVNWLLVNKWFPNIESRGCYASRLNTIYILPTLRTFFRGYLAISLHVDIGLLNQLSRWAQDLT